ncbi:hypothetical protein Mgra_00001758 [Meloidogyne graminicola]|uniref:FLYWCH-type domain-containing protein n=1 Tax=Meloidogyne graminicola TaxID=189291 RepID=A0A8T0A064_9BILA|nr:hypothetical protein Mgra_00001758 [Meloidogyne graminicola]
MESQINTNINPDNEFSSNLKQPKCPLIEDEGSNVEIVVDDDQILQFPESTEQPMEKPINDQLVEFLRGVTNFGNLCIWHEGYRYSKLKGPYWRCSDRKCPAKAIAHVQEDGRILGRTKLEHTHFPQPERRQAELKRFELKQRALEEPNAVRSRLIANVRSEVDDETFIAMGTDNALGLMTYRARTKLFGRVGLNVEFSSIQIPPTLVERNGHSILLYDSRIQRPNDHQQTVLVFAHPFMLQQLSIHPSWTMSGLPNSAPKQFKQSFVIGVIIRNRVIFAARALLTGDSSSFYEEALDVIANSIEPSKPTKILDYDNEMVCAAQNVFPEALCSGSYTRFSQTLFRKWKELKLGALYGNEKGQEGSIARMTFRRVLCLALIPVEYVIRAFYIIAELASIPQLAEFIYFFKRTYIGLTDYEFRMKSLAFGPNFEDNLMQIEQTVAFTEEGNSHAEHIYSSSQSKYESSRHSEIVVTNISLPMSLQPIRHRPYCPIEFWNIHDSTLSALATTNYTTESTNFQFKTQPLLPDYLLAFWEDFENQRDAARSAITNKQKRHKKSAVREELVDLTLREASYEADQDILNTLDMLSHHIQGYVNFLHFDTRIIYENSDTFLNNLTPKCEYDKFSSPSTSMQNTSYL